MEFWNISYQEAIQVIEQEYTDSRGIIVTKNDDRGDAFALTNRYYYLRKLNEPDNKELDTKYSEVMKHFEIEPNKYVRHPDGITPYKDGTKPQDYVADTKRFSRDQQDTGVMALGEYPEEKERLHRLYEEQMAHGYQNKDFAGPQHIGRYVRALMLKVAYPLLMWYDSGLLVDSYLDLWKKTESMDEPKDKWDVGDSVNHTLAIIQAHERLPTPLSFWARKVFKKSNPFESMQIYFRPEAGSPPLDIIAYPIMKKVGLVE